MMMMRNILKNTRKTTLEAKAMGTMPSSVVVAPTNTDGPISPMALATRNSVEAHGSCSICGEHGGQGPSKVDLRLCAAVVAPKIGKT